MTGDDALLDKLVKALIDAEDALTAGPVAARVGRAEARAQIDAVDLQRGGLPASAALSTLASWLSRWGLRTGHQRFFGYPNASSLLVSAAGDALAARFDPQCALWDSAPAAVTVERAALDALAKAAGWSFEASSFTTGASESLTTALVAAGLRAEPKIAREGVFALGARPRVYASVEAHQSLQKSTRIVGWGDESITPVAVEPGTYALSVAALNDAIARDRAAGHRPLAVVATVGSTVTGAIDPVDAIADVCAKEGLFLHCDAAYAGAAALSERSRSWARGLERADSVAWDAHKFPGLALGTGMHWVRDAALLRAAFDVEATYVANGDAQPYASTMQWSRRAIGLKVWLSLATEGVEGWAREFERRIALGARLRDGVRSRGWTVRNDTPLPVVCAVNARWEPRDPRYRKLARALANAHNTWVDIARTSDDTTVLRAAISSPRTDESAVDALVAALDAA